MSDSPPPDPEAFLRRLSEAGKNVRFGRGVVGKTGHAVIGVLVMWGAIVWRLGPDLWVDGALLLAGCAGSGLFVWWTKSTQNFAERNPAQAMLEGAEFVEYQRLEAEVKGNVSGSRSLVEDKGRETIRLPAQAPIND